MGLAGCVTYDENAAAEELVYSWADRPRREPRSVAHRTLQRSAQSSAGVGDVGEQGFTCRHLRMSCPAPFERVTANAKRECGVPAIRGHHPAVASREGDERHELRRQRAIAEMRREAN